MDISLPSPWSSQNVTVSTRETRDPEKPSRNTWPSYVVWLITASSVPILMSTSGIDSSANSTTLPSSGSFWQRLTWIYGKPSTSHKQQKQQPGMPTSCTRRKLQSLHTNIVLIHRLQSSKVDLRLGSKPCYRRGGTDHRQEDCPGKNATCDYCHKTGHIDVACRKKRADQNSLCHNEQPRCRRPLGTRQGQFERTTSRRMTPERSSTFVLLMTRTRNTRGSRFGLYHPSTGDLSKWSSIPVYHCRSFCSVCPLRTLQTSNFHQAAFCSRLTLANECGQQVP